MRPVPQVLLFDNAAGRASAIRDRLRALGLPSSSHAPASVAADHELPPADVAVVVMDRHRPGEGLEEISVLLQKLAAKKVATLVWGLPTPAAPQCGPLAEFVSADASADEIVGRLATLAHYAPMLKQLDGELEHLRRLGLQLNRYFSEIDHEMRLAGRLQQDMLPRLLPEMPPLRFACLFRPASWVSGDIYDVFAVDRRRVGVFIADAMGHGTAAGLMTMFLRQVLAAARVGARARHLASPSTMLTKLHDCLVRQRLPGSQFVTATYAIVDAESLTLRVARGGHPYPIHVAHDGQIRELRSAGGLLGLEEIAGRFQTTNVRLARGDKVIFYTDGVEDPFIRSRGPEPGQVEFAETMQRWAKLDSQTMLTSIGEMIDHRAGSLHPPDDMTVVALEISG